MKSFLLILLLSASALAQVVPGQYIVELTAEPLARAAARQHKRLSRNSADFAGERAAIRHQQARLRRALENEGAEVLDTFEAVHNAIAIRVGPAAAARLRSVDGVKNVRPVRLYRPVLDHALPLQKVTDAWQQIGGMDKAGAGIKIAIIDTGVDVNHPAFQNSNLAVPDGFPKVSRESELAFTNNKVIVARTYRNPNTRLSYPASDKQGHGTGAAVVAAGGTSTGPYGPITGVAPGAWIGNYKVFPDDTTGAPTQLIIRAVEDAVNDGMDVLNLSLGSFPAPRPEDDDLVLAVENAVIAGKLVVIAVGNSGTEGLNSVASPATAPSAVSVGSTANERTFAGHVTAEDSTFAAILSDGPKPGAPITAPLKDVTPLDPTGLACGDLPPDSLKGSVALILRGTCSFEIKATTAQNAGAVATIIYARPESPEPPTMSMGRATLPAVATSNADGETLKGAAAREINVTVDFQTAPVSVKWDRLSGFSGRGPNSDNGIKPDLLAVGEDIYTGTSLEKGGYAVVSGTSFSSPTVAGAAALLMAARAGLTAKQVRSLLINTSSAFPVDSATSLPGQLGGSGLLNMTRALSGSVAVAPASLSFGSRGATVDVGRTLQITNVTGAADTFSLSVQNTGAGPLPTLSRNTLSLGPLETAEVSIGFTGQALDSGSYEGFLRIEGTQGGAASRVPYWYGVASQKVRAIQIFSPPKTVSGNANFQLQFRFLDAAGLAVNEGVNSSVFTAGDVVSVNSDDFSVPGAYVANIRAPRTSGPFTVRIESGGVSREISITVN